MSTQIVKKKTFLFQTIQFIQAVICNNMFSVSTISMSKTDQCQIIQFSIRVQPKSKYSLIVKNISIPCYTV